MVKIWYNVSHMIRGTTLAAIALFATGAFAEPEARTDGELWNEGVDYYRAGDVTNALRVLRPLTLSRTHRARAAELVAKIEYDASRAEGTTDPLAHLEEAAVAAQIALRDNPGDARANANFTRTTDALPSLRETARVNRAIAAAQGKDPAALVRGGMSATRAMLAALDAPATNGPSAAIARADAASAKADALSDIWIGLQEPMVQAAATNEEAATRISAAIDAARKACADAATRLGDLDADARYPLAEAEQAFTAFHKALVLPPEAMRADLVCQSNAWTDAAEECARPWQPEALDYTRAFRAKFSAWADAYSQRAASDTNMPPFSAEARAEIERLAPQLEALQEECAKTPLPPKQEEAVAIARRILELLPPESGGGQGQQQQQQSGGDGSKDQKPDDSDKDQDGGDEDQNQDDGGEEPKDGDTGEDDDKDQDGADGKEDADERELEAVLMKAQERSDEHEAEKKARMRGARLPPNERDW